MGISDQINSNLSSQSPFTVSTNPSDSMFLPTNRIAKTADWKEEKKYYYPKESVNESVNKNIQIQSIEIDSFIKPLNDLEITFDKKINSLDEMAIDFGDLGIWVNDKSGINETLDKLLTKFSPLIDDGVKIIIDDNELNVSKDDYKEIHLISKLLSSDDIGRQYLIEFDKQKKITNLYFKDKSEKHEKLKRLLNVFEKLKPIDIDSFYQYLVNVDSWINDKSLKIKFMEDVNDSIDLSSQSPGNGCCIDIQNYGIPFIDSLSKLLGEQLKTITSSFNDLVNRTKETLKNIKIEEQRKIDDEVDRKIKERDELLERERLEKEKIEMEKKIKDDEEKLYNEQKEKDDQETLENQQKSNENIKDFEKIFQKRNDDKENSEYSQAIDGSLKRKRE
ncbi:hypothetical protein ACTFIY_000802 [Dictyostelium cf. discoideum]